MSSAEELFKQLADEIAPEIQAIEDDLGSLVRTVQLTQAAYNALGTPDPDTLYVIVG